MTYKELVYKLANKLTYANLIGVVASSIWILSNSGWVSLTLFMFLLMIARMVIPTLIFPSGIFSGLMVIFNNQGKVKLEKLMFFLSIFWLVLFFAFWVSGIFHYGVLYAARHALLPGIIWGACAAMTPLFIWVAKDSDNPFMVTVVGFAQIVVIGLGLFKYLYPQLSYFCSFLFVAIFMFLFMFSGVLLEKHLSSKKRKEQAVASDNLHN